MDTDSIVSVSITKSTTFPSRKGFGVPVIVAFHTFWLAVLRSFTKLSELTAAGVPTYHPIYLQASAFLAQNPKVKSFVVAKRSLAFTQVIKLTVLDATEGTVYEFDVVTPDGVVHPISYTVLAAATPTTVATAIAALIDALADITAVAAVAVITCTTAVGKFAIYKRLPDLDLMTVEDSTADPGIATDLAAIEIAAEKNKKVFGFYGVCFDQLGRATIEAAATWIRARKLIAVYRTSDSECADPGVTDDVMSTLQDASDERNSLWYAQNSTGDFRDAALLGKMLPKEPGSATAAFKTLSGVLVDNLTSEQSATIQSKNGNTYEETQGLNLTFEGKMPSGEYIDITRNLDFAHARLQENIFGFIAGQEIIEFDQSGIDMITSVAQSTLDRMTADEKRQNVNRIFAIDVPPVAEAPKIEDTEASDRANRELRTITASCRLAGAIHKVTAEITVTV